MNSKLTKIFTAITFVAMIAVNWMANALPINGRTTGVISDNYPNLFAPAGLTFSIWGVIYLMLFLYVLNQFGLFQKGQKVISDDSISRINKLFILSSIANILWIFAWHYDIIWASVILMLTLLVTLHKIVSHIYKEKLATKEKFFVLAPFSIYLGWITVATIANITVFLVSIGFKGGGISEPIWAAIAIILGTVIGLYRMNVGRNLIYGAVFVWAFLGIYIKHTSTDGFNGQYPLVIGTAIACMIAFIISGIYIQLRKPRD
jgi:hypothetical protein